MADQPAVTLAAPVSQQERITILDSLRGIAVLGILLMNITGFALPAPAHRNDLAVMNEIGTVNETTWLAVEWPLEGMFRALFSILFGAGIILFLNRQEKRAGGLLPTDYFFMGLALVISVNWKDIRSISLSLLYGSLKLYGVISGSVIFFLVHLNGCGEV